MYFDDKADDKLGKMKDPLAKAVKYIKTRSPKEKLAMLCVAGFLVRKWKAVSYVENDTGKLVMHMLDKQLYFCSVTTEFHNIP